MLGEFKVNKHPKYGTELTRSRRGNGWRRSKIRQHRLEVRFKNTPQHHIWITGVFFDEDKNRLVWFGNLWNRKFWRIIFNRRIRHIKNIPNYNFYRRLFYLVLNCDIVHIIYHKIKNSQQQYKEKSLTAEHCERQIRATRLQWASMYLRP